MSALGSGSANGTRDRLLAAAAAAALVAVFLAHASLFLAQINDDAFITFRYSRFLASGRGPYFNPGEHVEGYTNFLWMLLVAPVVRWGGENAVLPFAKAAGVASGAAAVLLAALLGGALAGASRSAGPARRAVALAAGGLVAVCPAFAMNSTSGLETAFFSALLALGAWLAWRGDERERWLGAGAAFAAAALTRPEGAAVFAAHAAARLAGVAFDLRRGSSPKGLRSAWDGSPALRALVLDAAVVGVAVAAHLAFRHAAYDGEWLPNTYLAKQGGFLGREARDYVRVGGLDPLLRPAGALAAAIGLALARPPWRRAAPLLAAGVAGTLLPHASGTDWMPGWRLVVPYLPLVAPAAATGWSALASRVARRPAWLPAAACAAAVVLAFFSQSSLRAEWREHVGTRARGYARGHEALAAWLRSGAARPGDTVALMDIGIVGFRNPDLRILDITGLTDRFIARSPGRFLSKTYDPRYVLDRKPEFLVVVLRAPENAPLDDPARLPMIPWTPMELALISHPDFAPRYVHRRPLPPPGAPFLDRLAAFLGAERVFEHDYPGERYFLVAYRADGGRR